MTSFMNWPMKNGTTFDSLALDHHTFSWLCRRQQGAASVFGIEWAVPWDMGYVCPLCWTPQKSPFPSLSSCIGTEPRAALGATPCSEIVERGRRELGTSLGKAMRVDRDWIQRRRWQWCMGGRVRPGFRAKGGTATGSPQPAVQGGSRQIPGDGGCQMLIRGFKSKGHFSPLKHTSKAAEVPPCQNSLIVSTGVQTCHVRHKEVGV